MPMLPAEALHPARTCTRCRRIVLAPDYLDAEGTLPPPGAEVYAGAGVCESCLFGPVGVAA